MPQPIIWPITVDNPIPPPGRPTWLEIDLAAIAHNFRCAKKGAAVACRLFPVIKANAYGLGSIPIAKTLTRAGADGFCVALVEEAAALRQAGIHLPIVLLSGCTPGLEQAIIALDLQPVLFDRESAYRLNQARGRDAPPMAVHLKVDTGMGRMGVPLDTLPALFDELNKLPNIQIIGIISHLACADDLTSTETAQQLDRLHPFMTQLEHQGISLHYSLANSAGILGHKSTHLNWLRPGIMLYGASPFFPHTQWSQEGLRPVVRWLTHIISIREVAANTPLGYGHDFVTQRPSRIALLPVGYADGFSRQLQNRAQILTHTQSAPVIGRISMDLTMIDVTDIQAATVGSSVTLLGQEGSWFIGIEAMAAWMNTIPYEVLCRFGARLPRCYLPDYL